MILLNALQEELLKYSKDGRSDKLMRVAIATDNFGAFVRYISHDQELNPTSRIHGTRQSMINDAGHMLVQCMTLVALCDIDMEEAIESALVDLREKGFAKKTVKDPNLISGEVISNGTAWNIDSQPSSITGEAWVIEKGERLLIPRGIVPEEMILVIHHPEADARLARFKAIVTDEGGFGCHAGIIAREHDIPCIAGTGNATKKIQTGDTINLDLYSGNVIILLG